MDLRCGPACCHKTSCHEELDSWLVLCIIQGPELAIRHSNAVLASMNAWCVQQHARSGLTEMCRQSLIDTSAAESQAWPPCCCQLKTYRAFLQQIELCMRLRVVQPVHAVLNFTPPNGRLLRQHVHSASCQDESIPCYRLFVHLPSAQHTRLQPGPRKLAKIQLAFIASPSTLHAFGARIAVDGSTGTHSRNSTSLSRN